jgi:hypothetical protein
MPALEPIELVLSELIERMHQIALKTRKLDALARTGQGRVNG